MHENTARRLIAIPDTAIAALYAARERFDQRRTPTHAVDSAQDRLPAITGTRNLSADIGADGDDGPQDLLEPRVDDFPFGPPPQPGALAELHALARQVRARTAADRIDAQAAERARMLEDAEEWAEIAWDEDFHNHLYGECGEPSAPCVVWKGYADRAVDGTWYLCAVAHLGQGLFLAHHRAPHPAGVRGEALDRFEVIAPCACGPNRYRQDPVADLADLADVLDQILPFDAVCAGTCAASSTGEHDARQSGGAGA
jgi:hypothetical protein